MSEELTNFKELGEVTCGKDYSFNVDVVTEITYAGATISFNSGELADDHKFNVGLVPATQIDPIF